MRTLVCDISHMNKTQLQSIVGLKQCTFFNNTNIRVKTTIGPMPSLRRLM